MLVLIKYPIDLLLLNLLNTESVMNLTNYYAERTKKKITSLNLGNYLKLNKNL